MTPCTELMNLKIENKNRKKIKKRRNIKRTNAIINFALCKMEMFYSHVKYIIITKS